MKNILLFALMGLIAGCSKGFLDLKADVSMSIPENISDYQAMLDYFPRMNSQGSLILAYIGADEYELTSVAWHGLPITSNRKHMKNAYLWLDDIFETTESSSDWENAYGKILQANMVLDGLERIKPTVEEVEAWNQTYGSALFFRAYNYHQLAQLFCAPFDAGTSRTDLGLPLRIEADITIPTKRSSVAETYDLMIRDLLDAHELLADLPSINSRPSKVAVFALLSRIYLQMHDYEQAYRYSLKALSLQNVLMDYSLLNTTRTYPFDADYGKSNPEILFFDNLARPRIFAASIANVEPSLYALYEDTDMRKTVFYTEHSSGTVYFRGSFLGGTSFFCGLTVSETLLTNAESAIRTGRIAEGIQSLDMLAKKRYRDEEAKPSLDSFSTDRLLSFVLEERRRELAYRGIRWGDLRRLNSDPQQSKILRRQIDEVVYELKPNDPKYVWPIPPEVIELSNIPQNPR